MSIVKKLSTLEGLKQQLNSAHGLCLTSKRSRIMRLSKRWDLSRTFINIKLSMMAENDVSAVILPTTAYILKLVPPPARKMIDSGVVVALGSDYNPNGMLHSNSIII